jgi:hypothetical protein
VRLWWICDSYDSAVSVEQTSGSVRLSEVAYAENVNSLYFAFAAPHNIAFDTEPVICVNGMPYGVTDDSGFFNLTETQTEHYAFYSIQPGVLSGEKITITFGDARFCFRYDAVKKTVTLAQDETPNTRVPAIMHKGELYVLYGEPVNVSAPGEGEAIEYVVSIVPSSEWPTEDGQANFGEVGTPYAVTKGGFIAQINGEWRLFEAEEPGHEPTEEPTGTWQCVLFEDTLYVLTDQDYAGEPDESAIVGAIETVVPGPTVTKNFEANFGEPGMKLALTCDGLFILYNNEWRRLAPDTASGDGEPVSDALCLFFDGCLDYAPFENWVWSDHDDGLAADGMSFVHRMEEIGDKIPTIYNPGKLTVTAGDGVNLEPKVNIYDAALNTVAFGADISTVCTLDPGTYYVSQRVSRRETDSTSGYECVVRLVIGKETEHVTYSAALTDLLQKEDPETNVEIRIIGLDYGDALESAFVYQGKTLTEYLNQPVLRAYSEAYDAWYFDEYPAIDEQNRNTPGWEKHDPMSLFNASWRERHTEAEIQAYEQAWEAYVNARNAFIDWQESEAGREALQAIYRQECDRLNACGFSLRVDPQNWIEGTATVGLLRSFPAKDGYQYWIALVDDTSPIDE